MPNLAGDCPHNCQARLTVPGESRLPGPRSEGRPASPSNWIWCRTRRMPWVRSWVHLPKRRTVPIAWHSVPMRGWAPPTKPLTLQTVPVKTESRKDDDLVSKQAGFSLHAGIACKSNQRKKLERPGGVPLCRYITRPAIAERRLSLANNGNVVIALKTPYDDGTSHVVRRRPHSAQWNSWGAWRRWHPDRG